MELHLFPPGVRLCRATLIWNGKEQTVEFNSLQPLSSGISYKLNMYVGLITEEKNHDRSGYPRYNLMDG